MPTLKQATAAALAAPLGRLGRLDPFDLITEANDVNDALLDAQAAVAALRRGAVRRLRSEGWTLQQIGDALGLKPQRIHQIENSYDRHERKRRQ
jgi:hypothetical protein